MATQGGNEQARNVVTGAFTGTVGGSIFTPTAGTAFNIALTGAGTATLQLEATYDEGANWCAIFGGGAQLYVWSYTGTALTERFEEIERGVEYRLRCTAYTSTMNYRLSQ